MRLRRGMPTPLPESPDCHHVGAVLQGYLDGELGAEDAEAVAEHLRHCDRCEIEAEKVGRVIDAIRRQRPDLEGEVSGVLERLTHFVDELADGGRGHGGRGDGRQRPDNGDGGGTGTGTD